MAAHPWVGTFVASGVSHADGPRPARYFRRDFAVGDGLRRAVLHVTALGIIEAHLNGTRVGDEALCPGWTEYNDRLMISTHDVTSLIRPGRNVVGAIVGEGWAVGRLGWGEQRALWSDRPAAYMQLEMHFDDRVEVLPSDDMWRTSTGAVLSDGIYDGETFDARLDPRGWCEAGFDDGEWEPVVSLERNLASLERRQFAPIRATETLAPWEIIRTPNGRTVVDFGQLLTGWVRLTVEGPEGATITLRHCELMVAGEPEFETNRTAAATDRYTLRGAGLETWEPRFTFHGFRYVDVEGWPGELSPDALTAVVVHTDMTRTGWLEISDELLNQLHRNIVWSFRGNAVGVPTDCPQRDERLGWTGDINAFAPTAAYLYDVKDFLGSWLVDLAVEQRDRGYVPFVVPDVLGSSEIERNLGGPTALWGDVAVSLPWTLYMEYGDEEILRRQYPSMKTFVESVMPLLDEGLWARGFQFGDWLDPDAPPKEPAKAKTEARLVATAYLCRTLDQLKFSAAVLGVKEDEKWCAEIRDQVRTAFRQKWIDPSGRFFNETQTAYALGICFGLFDTEQEMAAGDRLADLVRNNDFHIGTGFAGTPWLLHALSRTGQTEVAYSTLLQTTPPSFLYPVTMGATTVWERWDAVMPDGTLNSTGMTSLNHYALGAVGDWMHRVIGGIEAIEPGYRRIRIAPVPGGGLTSAVAKHNTAYGHIEVGWETTDGTRTVGVSLTGDIDAEVVLPGHPDGLVEAVGDGSHRWEYPVGADAK